MVKTRRGKNTAGKSTLGPIARANQERKLNNPNNLVRRNGMSNDLSYKSSKWANGGPKYINGKVKYLAMTKKKRKNLYSRTPAGARVASACRIYKKGDKRRCHGKKIEGARKAVCGGGIHVCGYGKKSKKGKWHIVKNYCKSN